MNKILQHEVFDLLMEKDLISLEEVMLLNNLQCEAAYQVMVDLIEERLITEDNDGFFKVTKNKDLIFKRRLELNDWLYDYDDPITLNKLVLDFSELDFSIFEKIYYTKGISLKKLENEFSRTNIKDSVKKLIDRKLIIKSENNLYVTITPLNSKFLLALQDQDQETNSFDDIWNSDNDDEDFAKDDDDDYDFEKDDDENHKETVKNNIFTQLKARKADLTKKLIKSLEVYIVGNNNEGVFASVRDTDTPSQIIHKAILQNDRDCLKRIFKNLIKIEDYLANPPLNNNDKVTLMVKTYNVMVPLKWDLPLTEQMGDFLDDYDDKKEELDLILSRNE